MQQQPTPELVRAFYAHMTKTFDCTVINKNDSELMKLIGGFLGAIRVLDPEDFKKRFATTLIDKLYFPFEPGEERPEGELWSLWSQIEILPHEVTHRLQAKEGGTLPFAVEYIVDANSGRARLEAEAYVATMELHYWRHGQTPSPAALAELLRHYAVGEEGIAYTRKRLEAAAITVRYGAVVTQAGQEAIRWLNEHAPHLRSPNVRRIAKAR
jgi:hypothetical protein